MSLLSAAPSRGPRPPVAGGGLRLTRSQGAALARLRYGLEGPGIVLLVGAAGVGKSLLLAHLAAELAAAGQAPCTPLDPDSLLADRPAAGRAWLVDDAHTLPAATLAALAEGDGPVVLAGRGRLLSLVAREGRVGARVRLRAVVPPFSLDDSRLLVVGRLAAVGGPPPGEDAVRVLHEIAAGIPAVLARMVDLAALFVAEGRRLSSADVEAIHRRLDPEAC
jgi:type II secretory pathway predicted ATPase ExeA